MSPTHDGATPHDHRGHALGPAPVVQWIGLLLAPFAFLMHLEVGYLVVNWVCNFDRSGAWIHMAALVAVLAAAGGTFAAWLTWSRAGRSKPGDAADILSRTRLLGVAGLTIGAVMTFILLAQFVMGFVVPRCQ